MRRADARRIESFPNNLCEDELARALMALNTRGAHAKYTEKKLVARKSKSDNGAAV